MRPSVPAERNPRLQTALGEKTDKRTTCHVVPDLLGVEAGIPSSVTGDPSALGHDVVPAEYPLGNAHALTVEYGKDGSTTRFTGAADPRGGGSAEGY